MFDVSALGLFTGFGEKNVLFIFDPEVISVFPKFSSKDRFAVVFLGAFGSFCPFASVGTLDESADFF